MVAALQSPPRVRTVRPARVVPLRLVPDRRLVPERVVQVHRQPCPRGTRSQRAAVYWRRRAIAAALGLGIVATVAHAGVALGGPTTTPGRSPHPNVESVVVRQGDTLWSIAGRIAPGSDPRAVVDKLVAAGISTDLQPGEMIRVP